jgi:thymidylate synthase
MNSEENSYLQLLSSILDNGVEKKDRTGTGTLSLFGTQLCFSLENNQVPALTTKKVFIRGVIEELLFFLRGETDTKKLETRGINIWKGNTSREFLDQRGLTWLPEGDMGFGYGWQWRKFGGDKDILYTKLTDYIEPGVDQLEQVIRSIKTEPDSRRHIITAWNPQQLHHAALPPCHCFVQFYAHNNELSSQFYMRSVDTFLGLPFNILSYAIMTRIIAQTVGMTAKEVVFVGGDTHVYQNHIEQVQEQLKREPYPFPTMTIKKRLETVADIESLQFEDFDFQGYQCYPAIKAEMAI